MTQFYSYDPVDGYETHDTAEAADAHAHAALDACLDDGEWHEDTELVEWGMLIPLGEVTAVETIQPDEDSEDERAQHAAANCNTAWIEYRLTEPDGGGLQCAAYGQAARNIAFALGLAAAACLSQAAYDDAVCAIDAAGLWRGTP